MENKVELLSPAGDLTCAKAAVQNGADAIYVGASSFSARSGCENFDEAGLEKVINYAHVRNTRVHLALNTLIKNNEFSESISIAEKAYEIGIDAIIVQDLGLATVLINNLPKLPIHASTQMTIHNLNGVKALENLGFKRAILSRELSLSEIEYIVRNSNIEIETFVHGALCISYSGQCLFSSMVGGRSGNRGKCAQACRLPYQLYEDNKQIDNGYLLSPRDLCGLDFLPSLADDGVKSFKIEGRLKSPEYVATVTKIYRKYIDLYCSGKDYKIDMQDKKDLLQVFNRGNFSSGHFDDLPNRDLVFKEKPNNTGIYIGNVSNYNHKKGHITLNLNDSLSIGDSITFENEPTKYKVSELMFEDKNIKTAYENENKTVTIGRMKGNISTGDKIFKLSSKLLSDTVAPSFSGKELRKIKLNCKISVKKDLPITVFIKPTKEYENYKNISVTLNSELIPETAINQPITEKKIISAFSKTTDTPFEFSKIDVDLDNNLYISKMSKINALRREALEKLENLIKLSYKRAPIQIKEKNFSVTERKKTKISLLLGLLNETFDYSLLDSVDRIYIPLKFFSDDKYKACIETITSKFDTYIYLPSVINANYSNILLNVVHNSLATYKIKGFVFSNLSTFNIMKEEQYKKYDFIANYTLNVFNNYSALELSRLGASTITLSNELNREAIKNISASTDKEFIVYGKLPLMTTKYCLLREV